MTKSEHAQVLAAYNADIHNFTTQYYGFIKPRLHGEFTLTVYAVRNTKAKGVRIIEVNRAWSDRPYFICKDIWQNVWGQTMVEFDEMRNRPQESYGWYRGRWGNNHVKWNEDGKHTSWFMQDVRYANLDALASTKYKYCAFDRYQGEMSLVEYCRLCVRHKEVELLAKNDLNSFIVPRFLDRLAADKSLHDFFRSNVRTIIANADRATYTPQMLIRAHANGWTLQRALETEIARYRLTRAPKGINRMDLAKYIAANNLSVDEYLDYCRIVSLLGLDIHAFGYTFPRDFQTTAAQLHAQYDEHLRRQNEERKRKYEAALKRTAARINYLLERAKKRLAWRVGDLSVIIPHTQEEFTAEGHAMRNCIGGYYRRQADGSTFCFFIRKNGEPHADVEMSLNGRIKQCYTAGNKNVPLSTRRYANRMARYFAKQMKHVA